jgi:hypothetical protein
MRYADYNRGTKTGRTYLYAGCLMWWSEEFKLWIAEKDGKRITAGPGIKPVRNELYRMKLAKEGPWHVS